MWVAPAPAATGIADRLVGAVARLGARRRRPSTLTLWALDAATRAQAFYARAGFHVVRSDDLATSHPAMTRYSVAL